MTRPGVFAIGCLAVAMLLASRAVLPPVAVAAADVPAQLSDREFWTLIEDLSEPNGYFRSDNLVSDEMIFSSVVPGLRRTIAPGGVYLGVGPEQNFTYVAAIRPRMAFIIDIRRGNLHLQLLYKALFELSANRAEFVSRLFTKPKPADLDSGSSASDLMRAYWTVASSDVATYERNLQEINDLLVRKHGFPLTKNDLDGIEYVYHAFYWYGPGIKWSSTSGAGARSTDPTYADLMKQTDATGLELSYLATEAAFSVVKDLQARNAIVPIVGNFGGPKAIRAVGAYFREHQATVSVFYVDEIETYLRQDGLWPRFCANVATLPLSGASVFIRPRDGRGFFPTTPTDELLFPIAPELKACVSVRKF